MEPSAVACYADKFYEFVTMIFRVYLIFDVKINKEKWLSTGNDYTLPSYPGFVQLKKLILNSNFP
jgi:hypothetical protein